MMQLINCKECMGGRCSNCVNPETCLCASAKHGESLKNGVKVDSRMDSPRDEPKYFEQCLKDKEKLDQMFDDGLGENSPEYQIPEMVKLMISSGHIVSKIQINEVLSKWCKRFGIKAELGGLIDWAFEDSETFTIIKQVCFALGVGASEHGEPIGQPQFQARIVAEIGEGEGGQSHSWTAIPDYFVICIGMMTWVNSSGPVPTGLKTPGRSGLLVSKTTCGVSITASTSIR